MWSAAHGSLGDLSTWLLVLKYLGLCLAAGSSIWGAANDLSIRGPNGERRLTNAGAAAVGFTALGLIISLVSEDLRRRQDSASHAAQVIAEARRTNEIIISGQQLASLSFRWEFTSRSAALRKAMDDGAKAQYENALTSQGGVPKTPFEVVDYESLLLPLVSFLADPQNALSAKPPPLPDPATQHVKQSEKKQGSTVVLMSLDAPSNAILSFGSIGKDAEWASKHWRQNHLGWFCGGKPEAQRGFPSAGCSYGKVAGSGHGIFLCDHLGSGSGHAGRRRRPPKPGNRPDCKASEDFQDRDSKRGIGTAFPEI